MLYLAPLVIALLSTSVSAEVICDYEGSQREMNVCAIRDYKQADADLNDAYAKAILKSTNVDELRKQQRAWIKRRDARCDPKKKGPGTNVTIDYYTCLQSFTEIRTLQLNSIAS